MTRPWLLVVHVDLADGSHYSHSVEVTRPSLVPWGNRWRAISLIWNLPRHIEEGDALGIWFEKR